MKASNRIAKTAQPTEFSRTGALLWLGYIEDQLRDIWACASAGLSYLDEQDEETRDHVAYGLLSVTKGEAEYAGVINQLRETIEASPEDETTEAANG